MRPQIPLETIRRLRAKDARDQKLTCLRAFHLGSIDKIAQVGKEFTVKAATALELLASGQACFPDDEKAIAEAIANEKNALKVRKAHRETLGLHPAA